MAFGDFTVTRASTKNILGSAGLYVSVANNVPAFEFNEDGTYRGLLVEPGATNLILQSQDFNTTWSKTRATISVNSTTAPDGATTADTLVQAVGETTYGNVSQSFSFSAVAYTFSCFAKKKERNFIALAENAQTSGTVRATFFNLDTGAVGTTGTGHTATIQNVGNGWYRCSITFTSALYAGLVIVYQADTNGSITVPDDGGGVFLWQAQLETGSVATSPIVTTAGTASRVADVVSLTGASSLIGQTEGTLYVEIDTRSFGSNRRILDVALDVNTDRITIQKGNGNDTLQGIVVVGNVTQALISGTATASGIFKIAFAYKADDFAMYVNGVQSGTDTSGTVPAAISIGLGNSITGGASFNDHISSVALFPTRLANATLESITTL